MFKVLTGDCLDVMAVLPDNSVDSIVTDPPYGISFMGKAWDKAVPSVDVWRQALRVLKPGGHILCFAGTRTQHRMACALEDAGFEVRDLIGWMYGSGFPKSHDISKAIDKTNGEAGRLHKFTAWMRTTGLSSKQINATTGTAMGSHYLTDKSQPAIPTPELWAKLRPMCGDVPAWVDELVDRIAAEREVIGVRKGAMSGWAMDGSTKFVDRDITAPATDAARQWQGWGSALKPAFEPITLARKPLAKGYTLADNVLEFGTGGLNIDGCRVETNESPLRPNGPVGYNWGGSGGVGGSDCGRWPANLTHDGSDEVLALFPESGGSSTARFFYCSKASKKDRDDGLQDTPLSTPGEMTGRKDGSAGIASPRAGAGAGRTGGGRNTHPTVKPTALMEYLCRLITPPGGSVLDPFCGSGSTGRGAVLNGFDFIGIELDPENVRISIARIQAALDSASSPGQYAA